MTRRGILGALFGTHLSWNQIGDTPPAGPGRIWLTAGPAPSDTTRQTSTGTETHDAVVYMDSADDKLKILRADGTITTIG